MNVAKSVGLLHGGHQIYRGFVGNYSNGLLAILVRLNYEACRKALLSYVTICIVYGRTIVAFTDGQLDGAFHAKWVSL